MGKMPRKERELRARQSKQAAEMRDIFIDILDSYQDEYEKILKKPPVFGLLGAYQLPESIYCSKSSAEKVEYVGIKNHTVVDWEDDPPVEDRKRDENVKATGVTIGLIDELGKIRPIVFVREEVHVDEDPQYAEKIKSSIRLLVLLHELGHARDMMEGINFDLEKKIIRRAEAEAYAHCFTMQYAKKANYRLALLSYIRELDEKATRPDMEENVRIGALRAFEMSDMDDLRKFANTTCFDVPKLHEEMQRRMRLRLESA